MSENSAIEWTDHTFNPWWGCAAVSPGCDHCYAEAFARRFGVKWGVHEARRSASEKVWAAPRKWNAAAERDVAPLAKYASDDNPPLYPNYKRPRVFCASMADVFDKNAPEGARERLWALIRETPALDWLLLTKRIGNAAKMLPPDWGNGYANVWLGASIVNQEEADRDVPKLLATPARLRFLSCEPLLGALDLRPWLSEDDGCEGCEIGDFGSRLCRDCPRDKAVYADGEYEFDKPHTCWTTRVVLDWIIVGGESGPRARPFDVACARSIVEQCSAAGVACFVKQLGTRPWLEEAQLDELRGIERTYGLEMRLKDRKGGDPAEWPEDLRVREFPRAAA